MAIAGSYDGALVVLSVLIAITASYTALDLAGRMREAHGVTKHVWLALAAFAMGGGIWSMHFVAMLAFSLPGMALSYGPGLTILSFLIATAVTAIGFVVVRNSRAAGWPLVLAGLFMGFGIAGMHYTGMAAMRMAGHVDYSSAWVVISVLIAVGASTAALRLAFHHLGSMQRVAAAFMMGIAVAGMHYAAMVGATFYIDPQAVDAGLGRDLSQSNLAIWIGGTTFLILLIASIATAFDRHRAQADAQEALALRQSEERYRLLLRSVTDYAIFMLDAQGCVTNWNKGAERIKGYSEDEIVGRHFSCFYTPEDRADGLPMRALETAARDGRFEYEGWRLRKDGTRFWAMVVIDPVFDDDGKLMGFAKVTRDITERKAAREELEEAREALFHAQKMETVGQLTGGVAHDFNNLLMAILGSLDLLKKRLPPDDAKAARLLANAIHGAERGAALTQRMLAFARRQDLRPQSVHLPALVQGMADLLQRSLGPSIHIETRFPLDLPPALVDGNQLELAILNLCVNARDAMPDGGTITIAARQSADDDPASAGLVCLSVSDTGTGMSEEILARAQEPFFTTKGVGKGTGLGLSMVKGLAEQSNGRLVLKSPPGCGTTAEIHLPIADKAHAVETDEPENLRPAPRHRPLVVLVVDDDPLVLESTASMLEDIGHRVLQAQSGEAALTIFAEEPEIDLVISDQAMPGMTGVELLDRLQSARSDLKMLLASGFAELPTDRRISLPRLQKPFDQITLLRAIEGAFEHSRNGSARAAQTSRI